MTLPLFLLDAGILGAAAPGADVVLDGPEGRHAALVRRLAVGEQLVLSDGAGRGAVATVLESHQESLLCRVDRLVADPEPQPRVVVVQALPKGDRGELAVELMTEVGVDVVVPWSAAFCVTRWRAARGEKALARWRATGREAGKQARRLTLPEVRPLASTAEVVVLVRAASQPGAGCALVLHEAASVPLGALSVPERGDVVVVVGPEGGLDDGELADLIAAGAQAVRLGPSVLRTSSAGLAAAAALLSRTRRWG